uniref:Uncharacterized protein n=1 Tax=Timema monikensis TaxID=170555 RepID=A0A7R9E5P2_9NEOP|nr:unnamed protein product [Timema monikensis]
MWVSTTSQHPTSGSPRRDFPVNEGQEQCETAWPPLRVVHLLTHLSAHDVSNLTLDNVPETKQMIKAFGVRHLISAGIVYVF